MYIPTYMVEIINKLPGNCEQMLEIEDYVGFSLKQSN